MVATGCLLRSVGCCDDSKKQACNETLPRGAASAARRPAFWPEIAERAAHTSLRDLADEYGVSHETIRAILKRTVASGPQSPAA